MGSSRFPRKSLAEIDGKSMLSRMVDRIRTSKKVEKVVLATTLKQEDDVLESWAEKYGVMCYRGSAKNVLKRLTEAARHHDLGIIVEMLGDNPLVDGEIIDATIDLYNSSCAEYAATLTKEYPKAPPYLRPFPVGLRVQVLSLITLERCNDLARSARHQEHATSLIAENPETFRTVFLEASGRFRHLNFPEYTFAVNYPQNLELVKRIFSFLKDEDGLFDTKQMIKAVMENPDLVLLMGNPRGSDD